MDSDSPTEPAWQDWTANETAMLSTIIDTQNDIAALDLDPTLVMQMVTERAQQLTGADGAVIDMIEGDEIVYRAASGQAAGCVGQRLKIGASLAGLAIRQRAILRCDDAETDPRVDREACRRSGTRSIIVIPLLRDEQVLGLLRVLSLRPHAFVEAHVVALRLMAGTVSAALRNATEMAAKERLLAERGSALAALAESEQRFRLAFEHAPIGMALVALDGRVLLANQSLGDILGYSAVELAERTIQSLTHPEDLAMTLEHVRRLVADDVRERHVQKRLIHRSGAGVWAHAGTSLVRDAANQPLYVVLQVQDVTDRKRGEWLEEDRSAVLEMVAQDQPLKAVLERVAGMVERQSHDVLAGVLLLDDGAMSHVAPNLPAGVQQAVEQRPVSLAAALCAHEVGREPPLNVSDIDRDPVWALVRPAAAEAGLAVVWSVAVRTPDATFLALLMAYARTDRRPTPAEERCLREAGRLATVAIDHFQVTRQLAHLARHDPLTGLPNRLMLEDRLQQALALARRHGHMVSLLAIDLDHFKQVNDTLGHAAGDELLQQFARRLRRGVRESDTVARVGGDEFVVILPEIRAKPEASHVANKLLTFLSAPYPVAGRELKVTGSIGIGVYPIDGDDSAALQNAADAALYRAKGRGRNQFELAPDP